MDRSIDPCNNFYQFVCGGYMKKAAKAKVRSPGYGLYEEMMYELRDILESKKDIPGSDISAARNIYKNCMNSGNKSHNNKY